MVALLNPNIHGLVSWTPSIGGKVGIPRGILPHVQTGLTNWNPDNCMSHPGHTNWNPVNCLGKGGILGQFDPNIT